MLEGREGGWVARALSGIQQSVAALAAEIAARRARAHDPDTTLLIRPSGIAVLRKEGPRTELVLEVKGRAPEALQGVIDRLGTGLPKDCGLEFDPGLAVTSEMVLPAESPDILTAIVRNKVEGFAPWPLSHCLFGQRIAAMAGDPRHVAVDVAVVSRALVLDSAAALSAAGVTVKSARVRLQDGEALRLDFGGEDAIRKAQRRTGYLGWGLAVITSLVLIHGLFLVWQSKRELALVQDKTAALMNSLRGAGSVEGRTPIVAAANLLREQREQRLPAVAVLNELSALLPETVWLESLSLDGTLLEVKGKGANVPALIDILERSDIFREVNFASATELNEAQNAETFSIDATLESGSPGGSTP